MLTNAPNSRLLLAGHTLRSPVLAAHWELIGFRTEVGVKVDDIKIVVGQRSDFVQVKDHSKVLHATLVLALPHSWVQDPRNNYSSLSFCLGSGIVRLDLFFEVILAGDLGLALVKLIDKSDRLARTLLDVLLPFEVSFSGCLDRQFAVLGVCAGYEERADGEDGSIHKF